MARTKNVQFLSELTTAPVTRVVKYDDGAGSYKIILESLSTGETRRHTDLSVAGISTWQDLGIENQRRRPSEIVEARLLDGSYEFQAHDVVYGVGTEMLDQGGVAFDVTDGRYTNEFARVRFHRALTEVLDETECVIDLCLGLNAEAYKSQAQRDAVRATYAGAHVWKADGKRFNVLVRDVAITPQPVAAARAIAKEPPPSIAQRLLQYPLDKSNIVVLDPGNFTVDFSAIIPENGKMKVIDSAASSTAVNAVRIQLAEKLFELTGEVPSLRVVEEVFTTGVLRTASGPVDLSGYLDAIKRSTWNQIATWMIARLRRLQFNMHYLFVAGGGAHVFGPYIPNTDLGRGKTLGEFPGFVIADDPEWKIAQGL